MTIQIKTIEFSKKHEENGFTIVELMVAISVFTVLLLIASSVVTQITRLYYKGVIISKTQNTARDVTDTITRTLQFSSGQQVTQSESGGIYYLCVGQTRFTYDLNKKIVAGDSVNSHALWQDKIVTPANCENNAPDLRVSNPVGNEGKELLENNMRLKTLSVTGPNAIGVYDITISIIYGDDNLINFTTPGDSTTDPINCKGAIAGSQWCATSEFNTQIYPRVREQAQ